MGCESGLRAEVQPTGGAKMPGWSLRDAFSHVP
jgi:hypothetical protein